MRTAPGIFSDLTADSKAASMSEVMLETGVALPIFLKVNRQTNLTKFDRNSFFEALSHYFFRLEACKGECICKFKVTVHTRMRQA